MSAEQPEQPYNLEVSKAYQVTKKKIVDTFKDETIEVGIENESRKKAGLPLLDTGIFSMDTDASVDDIRVELKEKRQGILSKENDRRKKQGLSPLSESGPEKKMSPEISLKTPEDYLSYLSREEFFTSEDVSVYFPELGALESPKPFHLTSEHIRLILSQENWLQNALRINKEEQLEIDKELDYLIKFHDLKKGKNIDPFLERAAADSNNPKELALQERRGEVLGKKIFFNNCLEMRKRILKLDPNFFSSVPESKLAA